jgi:hypothetical protein
LWRGAAYLLVVGCFLGLWLADASAASRRVAIIGDYGDDVPSESAVADLVHRLTPDIVVTVGDNSYDATSIDLNIGKYYAGYIGNYSGSYGPGSPINRFFPCLGNHDYSDGGGVSAYLGYFALPGAQVASTNTSGNERYYDFVQGPIHFFALNSNAQESSGVDSASVQARWLKARLAASTAPWKIVYFHHSPYSSGSAHGNTTYMQWPFRQWGATAVLAGHNHVYERVLVGGLPYFVSGLGGRKRRDSFNAPIPGSIVRYSADFGAMLVIAEDTRITFEFHSVAGGDSLIDSFTLDKGGGMPGGMPDVAVAPLAFNFDDVPLGSQATANLPLQNVGSASLAVTELAVVGADSTDFQVTRLSSSPGNDRRRRIAGAGTFTLAPHTGTTLVVHFAPDTEGEKHAALRIATNDPDEAVTNVTLTGVALPPPIPDVAVSPAAYDFGGAFVGEGMATTSILIRNEGEGPLHIGGTGLLGADAGQFTLATGGTGSTVFPGNSVSIAVHFVPATAGPKSATLRIQSDDPDENPLDVPLTGTGVLSLVGSVRFEESSHGGVTSFAATVATSPSLAAVSGSLYLAAITSKGYERVSSVTGMGLAWTLVRAQCGGRGQTGVEVWVGAGVPSSGVVTARFGTAPNSAAIVATRYSGASLAAPLRGVASANTNGVGGGCSGGTDSPSYAFSLPTTVAHARVFAAVAMRSRALVPGSGYTLRDNSFGGSLGTAAGVAVVDREVVTPGVVSVNGTFDGDADWAVVGVEIVPAADPEISVSPATQDFGSVRIGTSVSRSVQIHNDGTTTLQVAGIRLLGTDAAEFAITSAAGFELPPGGSRSVGLGFVPVRPGPKSAVLRIASSDRDETTVDVPLSGTALPLAPDIDVSPTSHDFGTVPVNTSAMQSFRVRNLGPGTLHVTGVDLAGADSLVFAITSGANSFTLSPGDSSFVSVTFRPSTAGPKTAVLRLRSDDPDESTLDVRLNGAGLAPPVQTAAFQESVVGGSAGSATVAASRSLAAVAGHLYLAAVASKSSVPVTAVSGMGLKWTPVRSQCGGRSQTGVSVWIGAGTPTAGVVSATFASVPLSAVIVVMRYSGADPDDPVGTVVSANTNGVSGGCSGGTDKATYACDMQTTTAHARVFAVVTMRSQQHTPGSGYTLRDGTRSGGTGNEVALAVMDRECVAPVRISVNGTFSSTVDWAVISLEIKPFAPSAKPEPRMDGVQADAGIVVGRGVEGAAWIELATPRPVATRVRLFDARGRLVEVLWDGRIPAGRTRLECHACAREDCLVPAGIYFVRAEIGNHTFRSKLLILR